MKSFLFWNKILIFFLTWANFLGFRWLQSILVIHFQLRFNPPTGLKCKPLIAVAASRWVVFPLPLEDPMIDGRMHWPAYQELLSSDCSFFSCRLSSLILTHVILLFLLAVPSLDHPPIVPTARCKYHHHHHHFIVQPFSSMHFLQFFSLFAWLSSSWRRLLHFLDANRLATQIAYPNLTID